MCNSIGLSPFGNPSTIPNELETRANLILYPSNHLVMTKCLFNLAASALRCDYNSFFYKILDVRCAICDVKQTNTTFSLFKPSAKLLLCTNVIRFHCRPNSCTHCCGPLDWKNSIHVYLGVLFCLNPWRNSLVFFFRYSTELHSQSRWIVIFFSHRTIE